MVRASARDAPHPACWPARYLGPSERACLAGAGSGRRRRPAQKQPLEEFRRDYFLKWMRSILIIALIIPLTVTGVYAEEVPSSNSPPSSKHGPNYPNQQRGPAYPATHSNQEFNPSFVFVVPTPQQRVIPPRARPGRPYPTWPLGPFRPIR
jgi:hypothetical protein